MLLGLSTDLRTSLMLNVDLPSLVTWVNEQPLVFRQKLKQGRTLPAADAGDPEVRWDVHEQRLDVIEALVRGQRPEDDDLRARLTRELITDFQTELAAKLEACSNKMGSVSESVEDAGEEQEL
jgi:hypothetical protein